MRFTFEVTARGGRTQGTANSLDAKPTGCGGQSGAGLASLSWLFSTALALRSRRKG